MATASDAPLEILQHIFVLDAHSHVAFELCPGTKHPGLRLAHVSRRWRAAALGTSLLWSRLEIDVSSYHIRCGKTEYSDGHVASWRWHPALNQFLELAQNFPLHVSLTFAASMTLLHGNHKELLKIISALLRTTPRWESLSLVCHPDCSRSDWSFLDPLRDRLDSLEKLNVLVYSGMDDGSLLSLSRCSVFCNTPKLIEAFIMTDRERSSGRLALVESSQRGFHRQWRRRQGSDGAQLSVRIAGGRPTEKVRVPRVL